MPEEDQPSDELWGDQEALDAWFEMVKERRASRARGEKPMEEVPQTQNEYARELMRGGR